MTTKTYEEFMSEINSMNIKEALKNAEKCLEAFTPEDIIKQQQETIESQKAEIERLKDYPKCVYEYDGDITDYCLKTPCPNYKTVDAIKAEAVKEFAEKFLKKVHDNHYVLEDAINSKDYGMFTVGIEQAVNETKKEMVGEG